MTKEKTVNDTLQDIQNLVDNIGGVVFVKDMAGNYQFVNETYCRDFNLQKENVIGKDDYNAFPAEVARQLIINDAQIMKSKSPAIFEEGGYINGKQVTYRSHKVPLIDRNGDVYGLCGISFDITQEKETGGERDEFIKNLTAALETKEIAFKEVLTHVHKEQEGMKKQIEANIRQIILPLIQKLKRSSSKLDKKYVTLLEMSIRDLASSYGIKVTSDKKKLSVRELEICALIKAGYTSKEISDELDITIATVERHRNNIRKKLGIAQRNINLGSYLQGT